MNFHPGRFTIAVWDNIDMDEETGSGTTHHTNGILIQSNVGEKESTTTPAISYSKINKRQRTLSPPILSLPAHKNSMREGPKNLPINADVGNGLAKSALLLKDKIIDFKFIAMKSQSKYSHELPGWTGFNHSICFSSLPKSSIH